MSNDEKKYDDLIKTLKGLQQVKASPNFEANLKRRLNAEKYEKEDKKSVKSFFVPSRLVPSFGLAAAAIVIFLIINTSSEEADNPFLMEPKVREDMILVSGTDELNIPKSKLSKEGELRDKDIKVGKKDKMVKREKLAEEKSSDENLIAGRNEAALTESTMISEPEDLTSGDYTVPAATGLAIEKSGLNFRQIKPTQKEQQKILELKKKVQFQKRSEKLE